MTRSPLPAVIAVTIALGACSMGDPAKAATDLLEIHLSADVHITMPGESGSILVAGDDAVVIYDIAPGEAEGFAFLGTLDQADVDAFHAADACGAALYSLDATAEIAGTVMRPADVFREVGLKVLDAAFEGIPDGVGLDAVARDPATCDLLISFDTTVELDGVMFRPSDVVRFSGGTFSLFRLGPANADLDAVHVLDTGAMLASFAAPVPDLGFAFADEDIVEQTFADGAWTLSFQPASIDESWEAADTDAIFAVRAPIAGDFRWISANVEVLEGQGTLVVTIERVNFAEGPVTISWSTADGSATSGIDFGGASGSVGFGDGETSETVPVTLFDDGEVDGDKSFFVDLTSATNGGNLVSPSRVEVLIRDDEDFIFAGGFESD